jgi:hypothetical protein
MSAEIEVFCYGCGARGRMEKVATTVQHTCGSYEVDLWEGTPEQRRLHAAARTGGPAFTDFMRRGNTQQPMPRPREADDRWPEYVGDDPEPGWDEYPGPGPHPNGMSVPQHTDTTPRAPTKKQPGVIEDSNLYVYDKHNPHPGYGESAPPPLVAPHRYPSNTTHTPFLGQKREVEGITLTGAACPTCAAPHTALVPDYRDHAHWYCPRKCGSLADLDRAPGIDPYRPPNTIAWGSDAYRREKKLLAGKKNGQLFKRIAKIAETNPGLSGIETVHLARQSVIKFPEA